MNQQPPPCLRNVTVAVLAGGLGTRVKGILGDTPKLLAPLAGKPFLRYLLAWLGGFGARRLVFCLGVGAEKVVAHIDGLSLEADWRIEPLVEPQPLGTGGALSWAKHALTESGDPVLVVNGDTFVGADLCAFLAAFQQAQTPGAMLCARVPDISRFGRVEMDANGLISHFIEKDPHHHGPGLINAGLLLLRPELIRALPEGRAFSLEKEILNRLPPGSLLAHPGAFPFIDFGAPDSYDAAQEFFRARPALGDDGSMR